MTKEQFVTELINSLELPFDIEEVSHIEKNLHGGVYIDLEDNTCFLLTLEQTPA